MLRRVGIAVTVLGIVMMLGLLLLWLAARAFGDRIPNGVVGWSVIMAPVYIYICIIILIVGYNMMWRGRQAPRSVLSGRPSEGTVVGVAGTTHKLGTDRFQYKVTVRFPTEDGQEVTAVDWPGLTPMQHARLKVGTSVALHYNPAKPTQMRIEVGGALVSPPPGVVYGKATDKETTPKVLIERPHEPVQRTAPETPPPGTTTMSPGPAARPDPVAMGPGPTAVRTDPTAVRTDPTAIRTDPTAPSAGTPGPLGNMLPPDLFGVLTEADNERIKSGIRAQGVIMSAKPTGIIESGMGEMSLEVRVIRADDTQFDVTVVRPLHTLAVIMSPPGSVVDVYYRADDEQHVTLQPGASPVPSHW